MPVKFLGAFLLFVFIAVRHPEDVVDALSSFISHDEQDDFFKADSKITSELNRRMSPGNVAQFLSQRHNKISPGSIKKEVEFWNLERDEKESMDSQELLNDTRRRGGWNYPNDAKNYTVKYKIIDLMQQTIYTTQKRIDVFRNITSKYEKKSGFKFGVYFAALDKWILDMHIAYTWSMKKERSALTTIIYHTHLAKRNVDITYTVEEIIRFYNAKQPRQENIRPTTVTPGTTN